MLVDEMRLAFVFENDRERIEPFDDAAQLKTVHQIDGHRRTVSLALREKLILETDGHVAGYSFQASLSCAMRATSSRATQIVPGSLRNHARWRRAYRRVARLSESFSSASVHQPAR